VRKLKRDERIGDVNINTLRGITNARDRTGLLRNQVQEGGEPLGRHRWQRVSIRQLR
jgi:hypothetical protein